MVVVQMPRYQYFWSQQLRYSLIADVMQKISTIATLLTSVDSSTQSEVNATDKPFNIKPIIDMVRQQDIKVESELHSIDKQIEQIIPCKTKRLKIRHITWKEKTNEDVQRMMYDFYLYGDKDEALETI